jgi:hypothetical protein|tara:strand:- start:918 stop:1652 length:735 start_codon:yes stop_codon:yes gene_type:complete
MNHKEIIDKLRDDENYYGEFGQQFLSNSNIKTLLSDPINLYVPTKKTTAMLIGGYFHTIILEPEKVKNFRVIESSSRNTKQYKEISGGELCLLQQEADKINLMTDKLLKNKFVETLITGTNIIYEEPAMATIHEQKWKAKADIINYDENLVIDLKTTNDVDNFRFSAKKYNYDSQAFIYNKLFGFEMIFIVMDKNTHQIKICDCSPQFLERGEEKVIKAVEAFVLHHKTENFDPTQYFTNETLT